MKQISILELRKNIYAATKELPVEVTAKGKTLFYIVERVDEGLKVATTSSPNAQEGPSKKVKLSPPVKREAKRSEPKKAPLFCPKHRAMLIGDHYSCGCKV